MTLSRLRRGLPSCGCGLSLGLPSLRRRTSRCPDQGSELAAAASPLRACVWRSAPADSTSPTHIATAAPPLASAEASSIWANLGFLASGCLGTGGSSSREPPCPNTSCSPSTPSAYSAPRQSTGPRTACAEVSSLIESVPSPVPLCDAPPGAAAVVSRTAPPALSSRSARTHKPRPPTTTAGRLPSSAPGGLHGWRPL